MCGIVGIVSDSHRDVRDLHAMLARVAHRGPDDERIHIGRAVMLGARRLSIVDPEGGAQPFVEGGGRLAVVFNGEIYNHREIRAQLESQYDFRTTGDTEVVLRAYQEWGVECVHRFNGMFAFAIVDGELLFMARDRLGEKPLYYYHRGGTFLFASEIKAIIAVVDPRPRQSENLAVFDNLIEDETLFEDVYALPNGCILLYEHGRAQVTRYWDIDVEPNHALSERFCIDKLRWLMEDAVAIRRPDLPLGCLLSGGLDSSIVAALAKPEHVFICHFPSSSTFDEVRYAHLVADAIGARKHIIEPSEDDFRQMLPWIVYMLDQPVGTTASVAEFLLNREARNYVKVVMNGLGPDEFFGGYIRHLLMFIEQSVMHLPGLESYEPLARYFWGERSFLPAAERYFHLIQRGRAMTDGPKKLVEQCFAKFKDVLNQVSYTDFKMSLPGILMLTDRASSAFGVEARSPLLDYRIVEFSFEIPPQFKLHLDRTKYIVHKAAEGIVPREVLERREKIGFALPVNQWLSNGLRGWGDSLLAKLDTRQHPHEKGNGNSNGNESHEHATRGEFDRARYQSITLELWYEQFFGSTDAAPLA